MSDEIIVRLCAPTLAGLKTGSLFATQFEGRGEAFRQIRRLNRILTPKGMRAIPVQFTPRYTLVYLYRPDQLSADLKKPEVLSILEKMGYHCQSPDHCLRQLMSRLENSPEFPHEIGLFLGYPPSDVLGFIRSPNEGVKSIGYWKVYGDPDEAEKTFANYKRCTDAYIRELNRGRSLTQLLGNDRAS